MNSFCLMCGREISEGFLCENCDKPRKAGKAAKSTAPSDEGSDQAGSPVAASSGEPTRSAQVALDPFPKAPIVPFPVESTSPAITSLCDVLTAAHVAAIVVGTDRAVRFVSPDAREVLGAGEDDPINLRTIEVLTGVPIGNLQERSASLIRLGNRVVRFSLVPLSGSAGGAVLIYAPQSVPGEQTPYSAYVRETVLMPLRSLHDALVANGSEISVEDTIGTLDQVLSSLELASNVEEPAQTRQTQVAERVSTILNQVSSRYAEDATRRGVTMQVDVPAGLQETFQDVVRLAVSVESLVQNALHYVPAGGQVVLGARVMEHKGSSLLLLFVMDNGPIVPEEYRKTIFDPGFVWDSREPVRTGKDLAKVKQFAADHGGQVWVESKSGRACTFFIRIRPDSES